MAKIKSLKQNGETLYPRTSTKAVLDDSGDTVESRLAALEASSGAVEVDTTLSVSGKAADAKATGDKVQEVAQSVDALNTSVAAMGTTVTGLNTSVTNMDTRVTALEGAGGGGGYPLPKYFVHSQIDYTISLPDTTYDSANGQIYTAVISYGMSLDNYGSGLSPTGTPVVMVTPDATRTSSGTMPTMISVSDVELSSDKKSVLFKLRVYWRYEDTSKPFVKPTSLGISCVCLYTLA